MMQVESQPISQEMTDDEILEYLREIQEQMLDSVEIPVSMVNYDVGL